MSLTKINTESLPDNLAANQVAVSHVSDWSTWTSQFAGSKFLKITERLHYIFT